MRALRYALYLMIVLAALSALAVASARLLPGGPRFSFEESHDGNTDIYVLDLGSGLRVNVTRDPAFDFNAAWSPDGTRMAFLSSRDGISQLYLLTLGDGGGVRHLGSQLIPPTYHPVWSPDGSAIVYEVEVNNLKDLYVVYVDQPLVPDSNPRVLSASQTDDRYPVWSPDGTQIAFVSWRDGNADIYTIDRDGSRLTNLTNSPDWDFSPTWSPDSQQIAFFSLRETNRELFVMGRDGSNPRQLTHALSVTNADYWSVPFWSPDGKSLAYQVAVDARPQIVVLTIDGTVTRRIWNSEQNIALPDGERIAYVAGRSSYALLYITDADGNSVRALTPLDADSQFTGLWHPG